MNSVLINQRESFKTLETPFYAYDMRLLNDTVMSAKSAAEKHGYHLHYALKANAHKEILEVMRINNLGADCVSGFEVKQALDCNFDANKIAFAGVGKTDAEINLALDAGIFCFNCESIPEIKIIHQLALNKNVKARIALRINPNVDAYTHKYITTGLEENKFGINPWEFAEAMEVIKSCEAIEWTGLHFHIGSQITNWQVFSNLCIRVNEINAFVNDVGFRMQHLNLGGGLGVNYENPDQELIPDFEKYFGLFNKFLQPYPGQEIHFEPGRCLVAQCGNLISRVLYVKKALNTQFLILDAGMTELIRPALYQAFHKIENLSSSQNSVQYYDVVGPICESSDCFGKRIALPICERGDLIAIRSAGAYGEVMASNYNLRPLPKAYYFE